MGNWMDFDKFMTINYVLTVNASDDDDDDDE